MARDPHGQPYTVPKASRQSGQEDFVAMANVLKGSAEGLSSQNATLRLDDYSRPSAASCLLDVVGAFCSYMGGTVSLVVPMPVGQYDNFAAAVTSASHQCILRTTSPEAGADPNTH
jgi:hypothetical protein